MASYEFDSTDAYSLAVDSQPVKHFRVQDRIVNGAGSALNGHPAHHLDEADGRRADGELELNGPASLDSQAQQHLTNHIRQQQQQQQNESSSASNHYDEHAHRMDEDINAEAGPSAARPVSLDAGPDGDFDPNDEETTTSLSKGKARPGRKEAAPDPVAAQERLDKIRAQGRERQRRKRERDRAKRDSGGTANGSFTSAASPSPSTISASSARKRKASSPNGTSSNRSQSHPHPNYTNGDASPSPGPPHDTTSAPHPSVAAHYYEDDPHAHPHPHSHPQIGQLDSTSAAHQILSLSAAMTAAAGSTPGPSSASSTNTNGFPHHPPQRSSLQQVPFQPQHPSLSEHAPSANAHHFASTLLHALRTNEGLMSNLRETIGLKEDDLDDERLRTGLGGVWDRFVSERGQDRAEELGVGEEHQA